MPKLVFTGTLKLDPDDDGTVLYGRLDCGSNTSGTNEIFSYVDVGFVDIALEPKHEQAKLFNGKHVLVIVEVIEGE